MITCHIVICWNHAYQIRDASLGRHGLLSDFVWRSSGFAAVSRLKLEIDSSWKKKQMLSQNFSKSVHCEIHCKSHWWMSSIFGSFVFLGVLVFWPLESEAKPAKHPGDSREPWTPPFHCGCGTPASQEEEGGSRARGQAQGGRRGLEPAGVVQVGWFLVSERSILIAGCVSLYYQFSHVAYGLFRSESWPRGRLKKRRES